MGKAETKVTPPFRPERSQGIGPGDVFRIPGRKFRTVYYVREATRAWRVREGVLDAIQVYPCLVSSLRVGPVTEDGAPDHSDSNKYLNTVFQWNGTWYDHRTRLVHEGEIDVPTTSGRLFGRTRENMSRDSYDFEDGVEYFPAPRTGVWRCTQCEADFNKTREKLEWALSCPGCGRIGPVKPIFYYPTRKVLHHCYVYSDSLGIFPSWKAARTDEIDVDEVSDTLTTPRGHPS